MQTSLLHSGSPNRPAARLALVTSSSYGPATMHGLPSSECKALVRQSVSYTNRTCASTSYSASNTSPSASSCLHPAPAEPVLVRTAVFIKKMSKWIYRSGRENANVRNAVYERLPLTNVISICIQFQFSNSFRY